ncbi:MAG: hypothetical protein IPN67_21775 [Bacteroidales bacterium]|nr:hypothetical protein [Bacteroidales bacterium]
MEVFGTPESPLIIGAPPDYHDFGIYRNPEMFATVFDKYQKGRFISINEFIGYIHSENSGKWNMENNSLSLTIDYDPHYCRYFETHESFWNLEVSDWLRTKTGNNPVITTDGITNKDPYSRINIPRGTGKHEVKIKF